MENRAGNQIPFDKNAGWKVKFADEAHLILREKDALGIRQERRQGHVRGVGQRVPAALEAPAGLFRGASLLRCHGGYLPKEGDVGLDKRFGLPTGPQDDEPARKMAPPTRRYWPSANSQRAPSRPQGSKKSPK